MREYRQIDLRDLETDTGGVVGEGPGIAGVEEDLRSTEIEEQREAEFGLEVGTVGGRVVFDQDRHPHLVASAAVAFTGGASIAYPSVSWD